MNSVNVLDNLIFFPPFLLKFSLCKELFNLLVENIWVKTLLLLASPLDDYYTSLTESSCKARSRRFTSGSIEYFFLSGAN